MAIVAAVQYDIGPLTSAEEFWHKVGHIVKRAQKKGVQLLVFPEYLTAHLLALTPPMEHAGANRYLHEFTGEYHKRFALLSRDTGMTILGGTHILKEDAGYVNAAFLFFPDGTIEMQKKVHMTPEERQVWGLTPGDSFAVYDTAAGKAAVLVCYDIEFPEAGRIVADMGAEVILCPSYTDGAAGYHRVRNCCQARAIENQLFVVLSGIIGVLPHVPQIDFGHSQAGLFAPCDFPFPDNGILALGKANSPMLVSADLDLGLLKENRAKGQVSPYQDRRRDIY
ncbi:MAG: carbon-nitrogen hydrolase family protein [Bacillota bacterium]